MLTIQKLEVQFDVEGSDEERTFGRLFGKYFELWSRLRDQNERRAASEERDRALGDRSEDGR